MTKEPYRHFAATKSSIKQDFKKTVKKATAKCRECRQVRNLNLHKLYNGQTPEQKKNRQRKPTTNTKDKSSKCSEQIFCVKS